MMLKYFAIISLFSMQSVHALDSMDTTKVKCPKLISRLTIENLVSRQLTKVQMVGQDNVQRSFDLDLESAKNALKQRGLLKNDRSKTYPFKNATPFKNNVGKPTLMCAYGKGEQTIHLFVDTQ